MVIDIELRKKMSFLLTMYPNKAKITKKVFIFLTPNCFLIDFNLNLTLFYRIKDEIHKDIDVK